MSFFSGLDSERYDRQYSDRELVRRIVSYFRPFGAQLAAVSVFILLISASGAAVPVLVARGVDELSATYSQRQMLILVGAVLLSGVVVWVSNWMRRRIVARIIGDIILALRTGAFRAAVAHDLSFYDEFASGKVVSRITSDTQDFGNTVVLVTDLISQFIQSLILAVFLIRIDLRLALLTFAFLPVLFLAALGFRRMARAVTREGMRAMANVNATIKETVSGIAVAKNFRQEHLIFEEFDRANQQSYRVNVRRGMVLSMVFPSLNALSGIATALLLYFGGLATAAGTVTVGSWYLFMESLDRFFFPVLNLSAFWTQVQQGLSAAERIFALMDAEPQVVQVDQRPVPLLRGDIRFENVCFRYSDKETVLEDFNLHVSPGETVALVGHTGAGKSSIARLIARFYEFQKGRILIDGHDIRTFNLNDYRRQLGIVSQTPFLFSGTVEENICYACPGGANREQIEYVANQIGGGEWLETLSHGLDTEVGERGALLSMGQRQLVSLMRVLVQQPAVFILDEATASIDPFTERQIQEALNLILANTTSIIIAHRLSTVKAADRIIVLDHGKIIEEGNHEELLQRGGHYATLYNTYFRHQSLAYVEEARRLAAEAHEREQTSRG
ncbi:MAG: ABC transporter ATP-binding protein [Chloroflexi bacterium]|jgi:ATP-binding cassette subfamily B protein|nr:ABC transporter ATP-binding protein [Chloroflexota bacterium]